MGDLPRLNRWTVFRRQADVIHRQHLPMNESSACSSSLVSRAPVCGKVGARLWQGRRETDGLFSFFELEHAPERKAARSIKTRKLS